MFEVEAALVNLNKSKFISRKFLLPLEKPDVDLSLYKFEQVEELEVYTIYRSSVKLARKYDPYYSLVAESSTTTTQYESKLMLTPPAPENPYLDLFSATPSDSKSKLLENSSCNLIKNNDSETVSREPLKEEVQYIIYNEGDHCSTIIGEKDNECHLAIEETISDSVVVVGAKLADYPNKSTSNTEESSSEVQGLPINFTISENRLCSEEVSQLITALDVESPGNLSTPIYTSEWLDLATSGDQQRSAFMMKLDEEDQNDEEIEEVEEMEEVEEVEELEEAEEVEEIEEIEEDEGCQEEADPTVPVMEAGPVIAMYKAICKANVDKSILRHFVPEDVQSEVNDYYRALPPKRQNLQGWIFATNVIEWGYMTLISKQLEEWGVYKHVPLQQADSFDVWQSKYLHKAKHPDVAQASASLLKITTDSCDQESATSSPFHHINFLGQKVFKKSRTPPEVSLWVAIMSERFSTFEPLTRKGVLASQAMKMVDPFQFRGPKHFLELSGTELRDSVTGYVDKVYLPVGTWVKDRYEEDEEMPKTTEEVSTYWDNREFGFDQMQTPYLMQPDDNDIVINDNVAFHPTCQKLVDGQPYTGYGPSKLSEMQMAEGNVFEPEIEKPIGEVDIAAAASMPIGTPVIPAEIRITIDSTVNEIYYIVVEDQLEFPSENQTNLFGILATNAPKQNESIKSATINDSYNPSHAPKPRTTNLKTWQILGVIWIVTILGIQYLLDT